jgi:hypothetical protein
MPSMTLPARRSGQVKRQSVDAEQFAEGNIQPADQEEK